MSSPFRRLLPVAIAVLAATAVTACGESGAGTTAAADDGSDGALAFAKCMRAHGIDMPDPKGGGMGATAAVRVGGSPDAMDQAMAACKDKAGAPKPPTPEQQAEFRDQALKYARCMRKHGIDMPDPSDAWATTKFDDSPAFRRAAEACSDGPAGSVPASVGGVVAGPSTSGGNR